MLPFTHRSVAVVITTVTERGRVNGLVGHWEAWVKKLSILAGGGWWAADGSGRIRGAQDQAGGFAAALGLEE